MPQCGWTVGAHSQQAEALPVATRSMSWVFGSFVCTKVFPSGWERMEEEEEEARGAFSVVSAFLPAARSLLALLPISLSRSNASWS